MYVKQLLISFIVCMPLMGCIQNTSENSTDAQVVFEQGCYPQAIFWQGNYYYTMQLAQADSIVLYSSSSLTGIQSGQKRSVWHTDSLLHIWSPELHRVNSKWYLYFEADNGNTDNHQLYVLENASDDPMKGEFIMKGVIKTNDEWNFGLHPTSVIVRGQQYLLWSGWQHRRTETETQCIYIARMKNPWTLDKERVLLSEPELEWERQWINPNGDRSNYPIFVNENPEAFVTPDGRYVCVCYSASGIWTVYHTLGMLYARTDADLLNPQSWTKMQEPLFTSDDSDRLYGSSNISIVPSVDGKQHLLLYEAYRHVGNVWQRSVLLKPMSWNEKGLPEFGKP